MKPIESSNVPTQEIRIACRDKNDIIGTLFKTEKIKGAVMIAPATGIKRGFYHAFASYLAQNGYGVITFDNRGIGDSKWSTLNNMDASLIHWGQMDMTAVLQELQKQFVNTTYHLVGHSAGGQLVGLMGNAQALTSIFNYASSSGSLKYSKYPFKLKSMFFLRFFIPVTNLIFQQTKSKWLGMGENLPKRVASEWSRWCTGTGYVAMDFGKAIQSHVYDDLALPSMWVHATDDDIANIESVRDMIRVYSKIEHQIITIDPNDYGFNDLGHMKFFSSRKKELWTMALDWLSLHT